MTLPIHVDLRPYRFVFVLCLGIAPTGQAQVIEDVPTKDPAQALPIVRPPQVPRNQTLDEDVKRRKNLRQERESLLAEPPKTAAEAREEALVAESQIPRPMQLQIQASIVIPKVMTSGSRSAYELEPGVVLHGIWRHNQTRPTDDWQLAYGLRVAMFNGSGVYQNTGGRFGFTYFGPMVGVGRLDRKPASLGATQDKRAVAQELRVRSGLWVFGGISAVSRLVKLAPGDKSPGPEFTGQGLGFDAPSIWTEGIYHWTYYSAYSLSVLGGVHLAEGKNIVYLGFGLGGWH